MARALDLTASIDHCYLTARLSSHRYDIVHLPITVDVYF